MRSSWRVCEASQVERASGAHPGSRGEPVSGVGSRGEGGRVRSELEKVERPPAWWGLAGRVSVRGRGPTEGSKKGHVWCF